MLNSFSPSIPNVQVYMEIWNKNSMVPNTEHIICCFTTTAEETDNLCPTILQVKKCLSVQ